MKLGYKIAGGIVILWICVALLTLIPTGSKTPVVPVKAAQVTNLHVDTGQLAVLTNKDREAAGLPDLTVVDALNKSSLAKCNDEVSNNYYAHVSPSGTQWYSFIQSQTYYVSAGENLAQGSFDAESVNQAWLASPEHKANILDPKYTQVGYATCENGDKQEIVEHFIEPYVAPVNVTQSHVLYLPGTNVPLPPCESYNPTGESQLPGIDCQ